MQIILIQFFNNIDVYKTCCQFIFSPAGDVKIVRPDFLFTLHLWHLLLWMYSECYMYFHLHSLDRNIILTLCKTKCIHAFFRLLTFKVYSAAAFVLWSYSTIFLSWFLQFCDSVRFWIEALVKVPLLLNHAFPAVFFTFTHSPVLQT